MILNVRVSAFAILAAAILFSGLAWADSTDVVWSSYLGGTNSESNYDNALDGSGHAYVIGHTLSTDFPATAGAYDDSYNASWDIIVAKFDSVGRSLDYATFLGGGSEDYGYGIFVDGSNKAYLTGYTRSTDFPKTPVAFDTSFNGGFYDAYVVKLNAAGDVLEYSTYLGGSYNDAGYGIAVDGSGNATIIGRTESPGFPVTPSAFDTSYAGGGDALVAQLNATGDSLIYCTFLGGYSSEYGRSVALDGLGNAYLAGDTESSDFPVTFGAFDTTFNGWKDAFVAKLNSTGSDLTYGTYLGGDDPDIAYNIAVDDAGKAHAVGYTESSGFPVTTGALDETYNGGQDAFVVELNASGSDLDYGTFLGGASDDQCSDIDLDGSGNAYLIGWTYSPGFPLTSEAYDTTHNGNRDVFVIKLNLPGNALDYSTFLGGTSWEYGYGIAQDGSGNVYLSGTTNSADFPTTVGAFDDSLSGYTDVWAAKMNIAVEVAHGTISGNVSENGGGPIAGAIVTATGPSSGFDTTDVSGNYIIEALLPGSYDVTATADGYNPYTQNGVTVIADDTTAVDFLLTPIEVAPPEAIDDLTIRLSKTDLVLKWSAVTSDTSGNPIVVDLYLVYRDTMPDFLQGSPLDSTAGLLYTDTTGVVGNTGTHYFYVVMAVAGGQQSDRSNKVGEFDKSLEDGSK